MDEMTVNPASNPASPTVRELDPADPDVQALLLPVLQAAHAADLVGFAESGPGLLRALIATRGDGRGALFGTFDADGTLVNFGKVAHSGVENQTLAFGALFTLPARRRLGHGSALLTRMLEWAAAEGCDRLMLSGPRNESGPAFAARHGGRVPSGDRRSALDLTRIDRDRYEEWARPSVKNAEYRTVAWTTHTPEDLLPSYALARVAIDDAPHAEVELGSKNTDVGPQRAREAAWDAMGLRVHTLAAVAPDGAVAGYTQVFVYDDVMRLASVGDTAVLAAHRGHGLGLRMKAELTLRILELEPRLEQIYTFNDETNQHMLRVNTEMGYELCELWNLYLFEF